MSRDLASSEKATFAKLYGSGQSCEKCGNTDVAIRIWETYNSPAKVVGGDIGPENIVGAVVICENCGHGQTISREDIRRTGKAA